MKVIKITIRL